MHTKRNNSPSSLSFGLARLFLVSVLYCIRLSVGDYREITAAGVKKVVINREQRGNQRSPSEASSPTLEELWKAGAAKEMEESRFDDFFIRRFAAAATSYGFEETSPRKSSRAPLEKRLARPLEETFNELEAPRATSLLYDRCCVRGLLVPIITVARRD